MKFEFCVDDLYNFFLKNGYDWDKKVLVNNEYMLATNQYLNNVDFLNAFINLNLKYGLKKLNLTLNVSSTSFIIKNCYDIYLGKLSISNNDYSKDWCEHLILTYGNEYINYFKKHNDEFLKKISKQHEQEKQKIDEQLDRLNKYTKSQLKTFNDNLTLIKKYYYKDKEM